MADNNILDDISQGIASATSRRHATGCTAHTYYGACVDGCETDAQLRKRLQEKLTAA